MTGIAKDRQFALMRAAAIDKLKRYSTAQICEKSGARYDAGMIRFESMGETVGFSTPDLEISTEAEMWHHLTLLQYLDTADGTPLTDGWIALTQMSGGLSRGGSFDQQIEAMFQSLNDVSSDRFAKACAALGGIILPSKADVTAQIFYAPRFPVRINFWEADDEYPASVKMLVNEKAEHYLTLEAAGTACTIVAERIKQLLT
ncbi:MAG: DUF3786 domain-containing protein [Clostridia bacterium]|nr:DUF3786 domain-containing protein [Clostridia bacterium]